MGTYFDHHLLRTVSTPCTSPLWTTKIRIDTGERRWGRVCWFVEEVEMCQDAAGDRVHPIARTPSNTHTHTSCPQ